MTVTQSIMFHRDMYTPQLARRWLFRHKYHPVKRVDITTNWLRYRIRAVDYDLYEYRIKHISDGIKIIFGYPIDDNMEL